MMIKDGFWRFCEVVIKKNVHLEKMSIHNFNIQALNDIILNNDSAKITKIVFFVALYAYQAECWMFMVNVTTIIKVASDKIIQSTHLTQKRVSKYEEYSNRYLSEENIALDLGCGTGEFTVDCADKGQVVAIDFQIQQLKKIQRHKNIHKICCDAHFLPLCNNSINVIIAISILEHVRNSAIAIIELQRILKNQGHLIIQIPNMQYFIEPHTRIPLLFFMPPVIKRAIEKQIYKLYYTNYSLARKTIQRQLSEASLTLERVDFVYYGIKIPIWPPGWIFTSTKN